MSIALADQALATGAYAVAPQRHHWIPPSEWLTQRAPPLPKLTQSASADNPRLPVFAGESHAKNSATVGPTKMARRTDQSDFARRPPAKIHLDGRQPRTRACAQNVPEHDDLRDEANIPTPLLAQGAVKTHLYRREPQGKGECKAAPKAKRFIAGYCCPCPIACSTRSAAVTVSSPPPECEPRNGAAPVASSPTATLT